MHHSAQPFQCLPTPFWVKTKVLTGSSPLLLLQLHLLLLILSNSTSAALASALFLGHTRHTPALGFCWVVSSAWNTPHPRHPHSWISLPSLYLGTKFNFTLFSHLVMSASVQPYACSLPGSSVHGILQTLEWVAISFSKGCSWPRDWTRVSSPALAGKLFTPEPVGSPSIFLVSLHWSSLFELQFTFPIWSSHWFFLYCF